MIRVIIFLALVALVALGVSWVADRPGEIAITWLGLRIETSVMVAIVALMLIAVATVLLWSLLRACLRTPALIALFLRQRRGARGLLAISRGLIAVGAGNLPAARRFAAEAARIAPGEPLTLLLCAQTAQLAGDRAAAELAFRSMAERDDTKLLGLRGLFIEARRRDDAAAAQRFAEEAARTAPSLAWAGQAAFELCCAARDWSGALAALDRNRKNGLIDKAAYQRQRAVLLTARALELEEAEPARARALALAAAKLAPSLVPAAELAGRLLAEEEKWRKASRIIEAAWQANPHPDLAEAYAQLRRGDTARERLERVQALAQKTPGHVESAIAVARAAIAAREFAVARSALEPLLAQPTQRVAELMAQLEEMEHGDEGRAREWMARALRAPRDPIWTADGFVSDRWLPVSPISGRLDAMEWKVPLVALGGAGPVIESAPPAAPLPETQARTQAPTDLPVSGQTALERSLPPAAEPVIPLVHAPDDPGPEGDRGLEAVEAEPPATKWWRLRLHKSWASRMAKS